MSLPGSNAATETRGLGPNVGGISSSSTKVVKRRAPVSEMSISTVSPSRTRGLAADRVPSSSTARLVSANASATTPTHA